MKLTRSLFITGISLSLFACAGAQQQQNNNRKIAESNVQLGVGYFQQGKVEAALEKLKKALNAEPDYPEAHSSIALVYQQLGEDSKAENHYLIALDLTPDSGLVHNNYATLLCKMGKPLKAERHFLLAMKSRGYRTPAQALENLGNCIMQVPDVDKAEKYLRQALQIDPKLPSALLQMVRVSIEKKNYMSGRAYLQRYQEVAQMNPRSLMLGIQVEEKLGDTKTVENYKSQLSRNFPDSDETKKLLEEKFGKREKR